MPGHAESCPVCGVAVEMPQLETVVTDLAVTMVQTDPGTAFQHLRDAHPEHWAEACERQRLVNANPYIGGMPRKVDGTFLRPGENVGDVSAARTVPRGVSP
jgi:hypothetical protein